MKKVFLLIIVFLFSCVLFSCATDKTPQNDMNITATNKSNEAEPVQPTNPNTYTGYEPLPAIKLEVKPNSKGLSTKLVAFGSGNSLNGKPPESANIHQIFFDKNNYNAVAFERNDKEKTLYLTFDCGYENGCTGKILDTLKEKNVTAAFFCTKSNIESSPELIARMITQGHIVGNHSTTHPCFASISREQMAKEIEECDNLLREKFGYTSTFFRYPKGEYSEDSLECLNQMGYKCVFWSVAYLDWEVDNPKGKDYAFNSVTQKLHPGAVILLHSVSPDNAEALGDIIDWAHEQGYVFKSLLNNE